MRYLKLVFPVALGYLVLVPNLQLSNLVTAVVIGVIVTVLVRPALSPVTPVHLLVRAPLGIVRYAVWLVWDIIKSGVGVARIVLTPSLPIRPGIIAIPSGEQSDAAIALSAHAITVTPGEMVVAIDEAGTMYTHCLDAVSSGARAEEAQATRRRLLNGIAE